MPTGGSTNPNRHKQLDLVSLKHCARTISGMGNYESGLTARDSRRELRRQRIRLLAYVGLAALAAATAVVVVLALGR